MKKVMQGLIFFLCGAVSALGNGCDLDVEFYGGDPFDPKSYGPAKYPAPKTSNDDWCDIDSPKGLSNVKIKECLRESGVEISVEGYPYTFHSESILSPKEGVILFLSNNALYELNESGVHLITKCKNPELDPQATSSYARYQPVLVKCGEDWHVFGDRENLTKPTGFKRANWMGNGYVSFPVSDGWKIVDRSGSEIFHSDMEVLFASIDGYVNRSYDGQVCARGWDHVIKKCMDKFRILDSEIGSGFFFEEKNGRLFQPFLRRSISGVDIKNKQGFYTVYENGSYAVYSHGLKKIYSSKFINLIYFDGGVAIIDTENGKGVVNGNLLVLKPRYERVRIVNNIVIGYMDGYVTTFNLKGRPLVKFRCNAENRIAK